MLRENLELSFYGLSFEIFYITSYIIDNFLHHLDYFRRNVCS